MRIATTGSVFWGERKGARCPNYCFCFFFFKHLIILFLNNCEGPINTAKGERVGGGGRGKRNTESLLENNFCILN